MVSKQDILKFISAEGFSSSGYEEQILSKFVDFLEAQLIDYTPTDAEIAALEVAEAPKAKAKK